jgi:hypothetical protein
MVIGRKKGENIEEPKQSQKNKGNTNRVASVNEKFDKAENIDYRYVLVIAKYGTHWVIDVLSITPLTFGLFWLSSWRTWHAGNALLIRCRPASCPRSAASPTSLSGPRSASCPRSVSGPRSTSGPGSCDFRDTATATAAPISSTNSLSPPTYTKVKVITYYYFIAKEYQAFIFLYF